MNPGIEKRNAHQIGLAAVFYEAGDRQGHRIEVLYADQRITLFQSLESHSDQWPSSPPLQQLTCEEHDGRAVVLGVGMHGRSHWSAAFGFELHDIVLTAEIACRLGDSTRKVGSTYLLCAGDLLLPANGVSQKSAVGIQVANTRIKIHGQPELTMQSASSLHIGLRSSEDLTMMSTHQWSYSIRLLDGE